MDDTLQRLLEAEAQAQAVMDAADAEHQRVVQAALATAQQIEARFEASRDALRAPYLLEARARAEQAIAELTQRYGTQQAALRASASQNEVSAVDAALAVLLGVDLPSTPPGTPHSLVTSQ